MSVSVQVDIRAAEVLRGLRNGEKRMAFAVSNAINSTAKEAQQALHAHVRREFIIRKPAFFFGSGGQVGGAAGKITKFANPLRGIAHATIEIQTKPGSKGGATILPGFELGDTRAPFTPGAKHVAVPVLGRPARPSISGPVPPAFTFAGLKFKAYRGGKKVRRRRRGRTVDESIFGEFGRVRKDLSGVQWKGLQRTFLIPGVGVLQRFGRGRGGVRLIWGFVAPFHLDRRLKAHEAVELVARNRFHLHLAKEISDTLEFNRRR